MWHPDALADETVLPAPAGARPHPRAGQGTDIGPWTQRQQVAPAARGAAAMLLTGDADAACCSHFPLTRVSLANPSAPCLPV